MTPTLNYRVIESTKCMKLCKINCKSAEQIHRHTAVCLLAYYGKTFGELWTFFIGLPVFLLIIIMSVWKLSCSHSIKPVQTAKLQSCAHTEPHMLIQCVPSGNTHTHTHKLPSFFHEKINTTAKLFKLSSILRFPIPILLFLSLPHYGNEEAGGRAILSEC